MKTWVKRHTMRQLIFLVVLSQGLNASVAAQLSSTNPSPQTVGIATPHAGQFLFTYNITYLPQQIRVQTAINNQNQGRVVPISMEIIGCGSQSIVIPTRKFFDVRGAFLGQVVALNNYGSQCQPDSLIIFFDQAIISNGGQSEIFTYRVKKNNLGIFTIKRVNVRTQHGITKHE